MTYSERFSDQECKQIYAELVMSSMAQYPGGEGAMLVEMASRDHVVASRNIRPTARRSWRTVLRLPFSGLPSLT